MGCSNSNLFELYGLSDAYKDAYAAVVSKCSEINLWKN